MTAYRHFEKNNESSIYPANLVDYTCLLHHICYRMWVKLNKFFLKGILFADHCFMNGIYIGKGNIVIKTLILLLAILHLSSCAPRVNRNSFALSSEIGQVCRTLFSLKFRVQPGLNSLQHPTPHDSIAQGQILQIIQDAGELDGYFWLKIQAEGLEGFVASKSSDGSKIFVACDSQIAPPPLISDIHDLAILIANLERGNPGAKNPLLVAGNSNFFGPFERAYMNRTVEEYILNKAKRDIPQIDRIKTNTGKMEKFISELSSLDPYYRSTNDIGRLALPVGGQFDVKILESYNAAQMQNLDQVAGWGSRAFYRTLPYVKALSDEFRRNFPDKKLFFTYAFRSFAEQKSLYEEQIKKFGNSEGVASPGSSHHQLGYAVDIFLANNTNNEIIWTWPDNYIQWMHENGPRFGISHPIPSGDPPHFLVLSAIHPGIITAMRRAELNVHDHYDVNIALAAIYNSLE